MGAYRGLRCLVQALMLFMVISCASTDIGGPNVCETGGQPRCECNKPIGEVDCSSKGLTTIMPTIPKWVRSLSLNANSFTVIQSSIFYSNRNLTRLFFENNLIAAIDPNAFHGLSKLERLVLKDNRLAEIKSNDFHHLTQLRILDLRNNRIRTIAKDAFSLVPLISKVNLGGNRLVCTCATVMLYQSLNPRVLVQALCTNYNNQHISHVVRDNPGICVDAPRQLLCPACTASPSITACLQRNSHEVCTPNKLACRVELLVQTSGKTTVSSLCETISKCTALMANNSRTCRREQGQAAMCHFCCTSNGCVNERLLKGMSQFKKYTVKMEILRPWDDEYIRDSTDKYRELSEEVQGQLATIFADNPRYNYTYEAVKFSKQSDFIDATVETSWLLPRDTSVPEFRDEIYLLIKVAASNERLSFGIVTNAFTITGKDFCSNTIPKATDKGLIEWYSKLPGETSIAKCPENPDQFATIKCNSISPTIAGWATPNTSLCQTPSNRTKGLEDLSREPITNSSLAGIAGALVNLTQDVDDFKHREVALVAEVTQNCLTAPNVPVPQDIAALLVASINKMLAVETDTLVNAEIESKATTRFAQSVERVGNKVEGSTEGVKVVATQLGVLVTKPPTQRQAGLLFETVGEVEDDLRDTRLRVRASNSTLPDVSLNTVSVSLPPSVLQGNDNTNVHFAVYNSANFFIAAEIANQSRLGNLSRDISSKYELNSRVVSAKVGDRDLTNLPDPVTVTLRHLSSNSSKHVCVYWDYEMAGWSGEGCNVTSSSANTTTCQCNHLTNFALLLDIYGTTGKLAEVHKTVLSVISYIGCAVSATGLILTLITYFGFRRMLRDNPSKILVNLCIALLGIIVSFIFTTQVFVRDNVIACKFMAALTHYFLLAAMAWMSVEAFYMYIAIVRVFHTYYSKFLLKCCLIGWGVPLVAVAITVGISRDNYGKQGEICWLARVPFFAAVLGPVALTLLLNGIAFGLVINQLRQMDSRKLEKSKRSNILSRLRGAMSIMVLLGTTWVFAFLTVGPGGIVFTYLFAICNSLQGLFIFVFYCLLKREAQQNWLNCFGCERGDFGSSSRDTMSYSTRSEVKPKANRVKPLAGDEDCYYPDEHSSPGDPRRKSCFGYRPDVRKAFTVSEQSNVTTSTTDSSTLVEPI